MKNKLTLIIFIFFFNVIKAQEPYTVKHLYEIGNKMDSTLTAGDASYVNKLYDLKSFSNKFVVKDDNNEIRQFNKGFYKGFSEKFKFGDLMLGHISRGSSYDFMNAFIDKDSTYSLMFRIYGEGINYHKHILKKINGKLKITDSYIYLTGEYLSDTFGNIYRGFFNDKGLKSENVFKNEIKDLNIVKNIKKLISEKENKKALKEFEKLSKNAKQKKIYLITKVLAASNLTEEIYKQVLTEYESKFPNDPSLYLVSVDGLIMAEKYDEAIKNINKLDDALGGDDFLNLLRGNVMYTAKNYPKAIEYFSLLTNDYPNFIDAYDSLLTVYVESNDLEKAIEILDVFINNFETSKKDLVEIIKENYIEFSKTNEFINWSKKE